MKIAIDARIISTSTGRYVERLLHYLEELDQANEYIILVRSADLTYYRAHSRRFQFIAADFEDYSLNEQFGLARLLYKLKPDLVHFCMPQQPILYMGKHVTTVHDLILLHTYNSDKNFIVYKLKQAVGRLVFHMLSHTSVHIFCPSNYTKQALIAFSHISPDKVTVTYEATDIADITPEIYEPLVNTQFICYTGQQSDYKNIRRLIQAHQVLLKKYPGLQLVLVGRLSGKNGIPLQRNREWVEKQGFKNVIYTDFITDQQLRWTYQHCATYVFPSLMEGFGLPGLEAMASGAPVVSSNATCLPEIYQDGAHYFDPYNIQDIARKIDEVLSDPALRKQLVTRGHEIVKQYSWQRMAEQTLAIYRNILAA